MLLQRRRRIVDAISGGDFALERVAPQAILAAVEALLRRADGVCKEVFLMLTAIAVHRGIQAPVPASRSERGVAHAAVVVERGVEEGGVAKRIRRRQLNLRAVAVGG